MRSPALVPPLVPRLVPRLVPSFVPSLVLPLVFSLVLPLIVGAAVVADAGERPIFDPSRRGDAAVQASSQATQNAQQQRPVYGASVEMVTLPVSVVDSADFPAAGLTREDFTIVDEGVDHEVAILLSPGDTPLEVTLLLDLSGSMEMDLAVAKQAALSFLEQLSDSDCVLFLPFSDSIATADWSAPDDPDLRARILESSMGGGTRLYDALVDSFERVEHGRDQCNLPADSAADSQPVRLRRRALVVVTDGFDADSLLTYEHALSAARQVETPAFPVAFGTITAPRAELFRYTCPGPDPTCGDVPPLLARSQLEGLARVTGGQYLEGGTSIEALSSGYADVLRWLRSYYVVGYYVETPEPGSVDPELPVWHDVEIRLRRRGYGLHTRPGYYRSPTDRELARYHIGKGTELAKNEQPAEALLEFDLALRADPYYWEAHYRRGGSLAMLGELAAAQGAFMQAAELNPGNGDVQKMASLTSKGAGDYVAAWSHAIRAYQAGATMTAEMQALSREAEPPSDIDAQLGAPRVYVQTTIAADPVANVALRRMLRTLRVALSEAPGIGLIERSERAQYELVIEPTYVKDERPRTLVADLRLMNSDGDQIYERRLTLVDIDDQEKVAAGLRSHVTALQEWLGGRDSPRAPGGRLPAERLSATSATELVSVSSTQPRGPELPSLPPASPQATEPPSGIFGFDEGEERRYTLDPPELLKPGELVQYLIRLESVEGSGADLRAKFIMENESLRFRYRNNFMNPDERLRLMLRVEVTMNRHGFPLEVDYRLERDESDHPYVEKDLHLSFDGDRYDVTNRGKMGMDYRQRLPGTNMVDRSVPRGIFLSPHINPGLLSVIYTILHDPGTDDFEYMELNMPGIGFRYREYRVDSLVTVDVGGVPHDALFLRDGPQGDTWITPDGTVLKVEIRDRDENAWLRLMHPWEY